MKKTIITLLVTIILLGLNSCAANDIEYSYSIRNALKISAYVFDESFEWDIWNEDWTEYVFEDESVFTLERLKMNEIKRLHNLDNFKDMKRGWVLYLEFNGIIELVAENEDMQISYNNKLSPFYKDEATDVTRVWGYNAQFVTQGYVSIIPIYEKSYDEKTITYGTVYAPSGIAGTEYYLTVNAYRFDNDETPIIWAKLKFVTLGDPSWQHPLFAPGLEPNSIPYFSVELISYDYSDMYKFKDEIWDDDDE